MTRHDPGDHPMSTDPTPDHPCSWCRRPGHTADAHPLPKDHPDYDAFFDASDDDLAAMLGREIALIERPTAGEEAAR